METTRTPVLHASWHKDPDTDDEQQEQRWLGNGTRRYGGQDFLPSGEHTEVAATRLRTLRPVGERSPWALDDDTRGAWRK